MTDLEFKTTLTKLSNLMKVKLYGSLNHRRYKKQLIEGIITHKKIKTKELIIFIINFGKITQIF